MSFVPGALVRCRGREWIVQPESDDELIILRPIGGTDDETTGVLRALESVDPASFPVPDPAKLGDDRSCRLLRDAVRLSFRSGAGPFRSFGRLSFEPRPYQLVPLLMALKQDPVRLLIADDVGTGKTIEAGLIVRELLDRGEITRFSVLCPPHLAEQWHTELRSKFHIEAAVVLASTAARLERGLGPGESLFDRHEFTVVSLDFIKSERRREEFLRHAPELILVDEAHGCAFGAERGGRHQRHKLVTELSKDPDRHLLLITATPHNGKSGQFTSLLGLLDPAYVELPDDLSGPQNEPIRRRLAQHLVQRRRGDLRAYLAEDTPFPERKSAEFTYRLSPAYKQLLDAALAFARTSVTSAEGDRRTYRIRWWSALALLRSLASSPVAAARTLRTRARTLSGATAEEIDDLGSASVLDLDADTDAEDLDLTPGADDSDEAPAHPVRRQLLELARAADAIGFEDDHKLKQVVKIVKDLVSEGFRPIVFCRFIPTAESVAAALQAKLPKGVAVEAVTGLLPPEERESRIDALGTHDRRVLVATDCLSEGINLQEHFDAVVHFDLAWNPTRHEQREGRVDRFGQSKSEVRVVTLYGTDNLIDGFVLNVLIKKHVEIRMQTGVSVPIPADLKALEEALLRNVLLPADDRGDVKQMRLPGMDEGEMTTLEMHKIWVGNAEREKKSRTLYAQETIKVDEVASELKACREAIGSGVDLKSFVVDALRLHNAVISAGHGVKVDFSESPPGLREILSTSLPPMGKADRNRVSTVFAPPVPEGAIHLDRTHPFVEGLADYVLTTALDPSLDGRARRSGAVRTTAVAKRTTVLLVRFRFHLISVKAGCETRRLAEEARLMAFAGSPDSPEWLSTEFAESLLLAQPDRNVAADQARPFVARVTDALDRTTGGPLLWNEVEAEAHRRAADLLNAHQRVRSAALKRGERSVLKYTVEPHLPADALGVYVFLPSA